MGEGTIGVRFSRKTIEQYERGVEEKILSTWASFVKKDARAWRAVKTNKSSAPFKPFRIHEERSRAKFLIISRPPKDPRAEAKLSVFYERPRRNNKISYWSKLMEFGGPVDVTYRQLLFDFD